jgi:hypothetical protein
VIFLVFWSFICRFNAPLFGPDLLTLLKDSPFAPDIPDIDPFFSLSLSDIDAIRQWPFDELSKQQFVARFCIRAPLFTAVPELLGRPQSGDNPYRDIASDIRRFFAEAIPSLSDPSTDFSLYERRWNERNELFDAVIARAQSDFRSHIAAVAGFLKLLFNDVAIPPLAPRAIAGRVSGAPGPPPTVALRRASFLSGFCARTLERVKCHPEVRRLLDVARFSLDARLTSTAARVPVALSRSASDLVIRSEVSAEVVKGESITDVLVLNENMLAIVSENVQYLLDFSPDNLRSANVPADALPGPGPICGPTPGSRASIT